MRGERRLPPEWSVSKPVVRRPLAASEQRLRWHRIGGRTAAECPSQRGGRPPRTQNPQLVGYLSGDKISLRDVALRIVCFEIIPIAGPQFDECFFPTRSGDVHDARVEEHRGREAFTGRTGPTLWHVELRRGRYTAPLKTGVSLTAYRRGKKKASRPRCRKRVLTRFDISKAVAIRTCACMMCPSVRAYYDAKNTQPILTTRVIPCRSSLHHAKQFACRDVGCMSGW